MNITGNIATENPTEDVIEMDQKFFPNPWDSSQWNKLDLNLNHLFTWSMGHKLSGFALFGIAPGDDVAHLYKIILAHEFRGNGSSQEFWAHIKKKLISLGISRIYLEVEFENSRAINFYLKVGFKTLRKAKGFYSNGGDALIMELTLGV
jgi:ribosomal-protein-alanine N-acetyltransferase